MIKEFVRHDTPKKKTQADASSRSVIPLNISERKLLLSTLDLALLNLSLVVGLIASPRPLLPLDLETIFDHLIWYITLSGLWLIISQVTECYDLKASSTLFTTVRRVAITTLLVTVAYFFVPYISAPLTSSRLAWAVFSLTSLASISIWRVIYVLLIAQPAFTHRVILVNNGRPDQRLLGTVFGVGSNYHLIGVLGAAFVTGIQTTEGLPTLSDPRELRTFAKINHVTGLVMGLPCNYLAFPHLAEAIVICQEEGLEVTTLSQLYEQLTGRIPIHYNEPTLCTMLPIEIMPTERFYAPIKRTVDIVCALVGLGV